jgi:hypothetical protein
MPVEARAKIPKALEEFYASVHPETLENSKDNVEKAGQEIAQIFERNMFPEMKTRWDTHPDNLGHLISNGCYRCHGSPLQTAEGKTITRDCNACHTIVEQGTKDNLERNPNGLEFRHPPGGEEWKESNCSDCHTGV